MSAAELKKMVHCQKTMSIACNIQEDSNQSPFQTIEVDNDKHLGQEHQ